MAPRNSNVVRAMESNAASAPRIDTTGTPECDLLLKIADPDVYRKNPFRVLGLPVDTSLRAAAKEVSRRKMLAELGQAESGVGRLEIRPAPTVDDLRAAEEVLHDPAQRLVHELFWFWPLDPLSGQPDPAMEALKSGNLKAAAAIWDVARKDPGTTASRLAIAKHNIAVRWHFHVLDLEATTGGKCWDDPQADNIRKTWVVAQTYWNDSAQSDAIWNALCARVIALNDDRASLEFVQSMRKTIGRALVRINATLALRYVDLDAGTAAIAHLTLLLESPNYVNNSSAVEEFLVAPLKESVRQRIRDAETARSDPSQANGAAHRLVAKFSSYLPILTKLMAGRDGYDLSGLFDEVVSACLSCAIAYYNATDDGAASLTILETILPLARSEAIRVKVEENIAAAKSYLLADKLAPVHEPLTAIEESKEAPYNRLAEFDLTIEPLVAKLGAILTATGPVQDLISDRIARLLRDISIDAWNTTKDNRTAFDALSRADKFARSAAVKAQLATDRATLVRVYAEHRRDQQAKKNKKYGWFAAAVVVAAIVIAVNVNDSSPQHEAAQPAHSAGIPAPVATPVPTPDATRTYSVPHYMTEELSRDRAAVEAAQAAADSLDKQLTVARTELEAKQAEVQLAQTELDSLGAKIERARPYVSNGDDAAVNRFNNDVAKYNRMVKRVQQMVASSDALVDPYNALLARTKSKSDEANRLVDAYNRKLAQVGH